MSDYSISRIYRNDSFANLQIDKLLEQEGIRRDAHLDYTCGMYDEDMNIIATGSLFGNTLRCMAVSQMHQGEGLMNEIVTHLVETQFARGNTHLFLYTKCNTAKFFRDLGFHEIAEVKDRLVFMENQKNGFANYVKSLSSRGNVNGNRIAALVMNANPFTNGHLYLVEKAAAESDLLHLFMVSEDASLIPFEVRKKLIMEGTSHISNICYHDSGPYMISNATFPSYFLKDEESVIKGHALLDLTVFKSIADSLHINRRYVGDEPTSLVTGIYNTIMADELPKAGIECIIVPRKEYAGKPISASVVRQAIHDGNVDMIEPLVPPSTYRFFKGKEGLEVIDRIRREQEVVHY